MNLIWLSLLCSFIFTNFMHAYLLLSQRREQKIAISFYAAKNHYSHLIYIIGHLLGGFLYLIFAYKFFYQQLNSDFLWFISLLGIGSEWIQALIPARRELFIYHNFFAWSMALFMSILLIAGPLIAGLDSRGTAALTVSVLILISCGLATLKVGMRRFWIPQMMYFFMFYIVMVILIS